MALSLSDGYFASRPNRSVRHPRLAVFFLACSGAGKSTISQLLVTTLQATCLRNDDARQLIREHHSTLSPKTIVDATWYRLRQESPNGLIVFDSNMSSYYMQPDSYYQVAHDQAYRTFVIELVVPAAELERRVRQRERTDTAEILSLLPEQLEAQRLASGSLPVDYRITSDIDIDDLVDRLRSTMHTSQKA